jgi:hypothetical protein
MRTARKSVSIVALFLVALAATACSPPVERQYDKGSPDASAPKPDDNLLREVTGWQETNSPGEVSRYNRLVVIQLPNGNQFCAMQVDGGSRDTSSTLTIIAPGDCKTKTP